MKKLILSTVLLVTAFFVMSCSGEKEVESGKINLEFAWCTDNVDISQQGFFDVATAYANYLNKTRDDIHIELTLFDGQASVDKQISDIETAVAKNVDGIILSCVDPAGITPIAQQAMAEGVPILDWRDMGDVCTVTFINGSEHTKGKFNYQWTKDYLNANPDVVLYAGLQQGSTNHPQCYPRMQYMYDLEKEMPDRFKILVESNSDWSADTSMRMVEDWLQVHKNMNYISSSSEEQMLGVIEALRGANVLDDFVLTAFNGETPGVEMIEKGELDMDVGVIMPLGMGLLMETAIRMALEGYSGRIDISDQAMFNVDAGNVADYKQKIVVDYDNLHYFDTTLKPSYK